MILGPFKPNASFVEMPRSTGLPFRKVAFAAIKTGESVAALANLLMELPVIGAMIMQSTGLLGPNGSAPTIVDMTFSPVASSIRLIHSSPVPNRVAAVKTEWVMIGTTVAPLACKSLITGNI